MIKIFFSEEGYYITGEGIEISRRCSPALTSNGDRIFQPLHHTYKVCYLALKEMKDIDIHDDVIVYNDSRIIDEINGGLPTLDETCNRWLKIIGRHILPGIRAVVFFRKKSTNEMSFDIGRGHNTMLVRLDEDVLVNIDSTRKNTEKRNLRLITRLRNAWFGETHG